MTASIGVDRPGLLIQRGYQNSARLPELFHSLQVRHEGAIDVAAVVNLPHQRESAAEAFLEATDTSLRIVDPMIFRHRQHLGLAGEMETRRHDYLRDDLPERPDPAWMRSILDIQRRVGATLLLTPTGWVTEVDHRRALDDVMDYVRGARQIVGDDPMLVNLTISAMWLRDRELLKALLEELVESEERYWHIRVRWNPLDPPTAQLRDGLILDGYRLLAKVASSENKVLLLPNTSLIGWLAWAWGAAVPGTGLAMVDRHFTEERVVAIPGTDRPPPRERWFEARVLHLVDVSSRDTFASQPGYALCECPYCAETLTVGWSREREALHFVWTLAEMLRRPQGQTPSEWVRTFVESAQLFWGAIPEAAKPAGDNRPRHLSVWAARLRR